MTVTLFTKPGCQQCTATYRALDKQGIECTMVDISKDAEALERVKSLGYQQVPVVFINDDEHWSGFRPDNIAQLAHRFQLATSNA